MIYKITPRDSWNAAMTAGEYTGADVDLADGFIHFSTSEQVQETAHKHFFEQTGLVLIEFDESDFGDALRWEPSRGGDLFPHLYGTIDSSIPHRVYDLPWSPELQKHEFPDPTA